MRVFGIVLLGLLTCLPLPSGAEAKENARLVLAPVDLKRLPAEEGRALERLDAVELDWLMQDGRKASDEGLEDYLRDCSERRLRRLRTVMASAPAIVYLRNNEFGNAPRLNMSLSDGPYRGNPFKPGAKIMMARPGEGGRAGIEELLSDPGGMIRDLDVSFDGKRILFSWKKSKERDDFHIYEMTVATREIRQITEEPGVADIQANYLPDGRILYHSTRCVAVTDCNESIDVVNMYSCDASGGAIYRLTYDQVSTQYPSVLADGRIVYTRWDYNDRGQIFPQGLFTTNPDGTSQMALYGNNSWYPTSLIQARSIPGTTDMVAIASGHHTPPCGKLVAISAVVGREQGRGVRLLAPERDPEPKRQDAAEQEGALFQYPYPLSRDEFLVGVSLFGKAKSQHFGIYWMNRAGERELLAWDVTGACRRPMPLAPRPKPALRPTTTDRREERGRFYVDDVYVGRGLEGIARGTVKRLRVIALEFRPAAVGTNYNKGEGGSARVCTPVSISGAWDTKTVLGDAKVHEDGSAFFYAPPRTAIYFQAIDAKGHAVQSMRSWSTLQPGESLSCTGCHADKNSAPANRGDWSLAMRAGPQELDPFYGLPRGFSFLSEIQPILDRNCIECHQGKPVHEAGGIAPKSGRPGRRSRPSQAPSARVSVSPLTHGRDARATRSGQSEVAPFGLTSRPVHEARSARNWSESYLNLLQAGLEGKGKNRTYHAASNDYINWISPQSGPDVLRPYSFGAARSPMIAMLRDGHREQPLEGRFARPRVNLTTEELEKLACWIDLATPFCGDYTEAGAWTEKERDWYARQVEKRKRLAARERPGAVSH